MPRDGSGSGDNAIEAGHNIVHGAGTEESTKVARADKTATPPPEEKGFGITPHGEGQGVGGHTGSGKGHVKPAVE